MTSFDTLQTLSVSIENQIAHIELCRPAELNTMTASFWDELPTAVNRIDQDAAARVIVISAQGKHFTAGMDLSVFTSMGERFSGEPARRGEHLRHWVMKLQDAFTALERARMPVLCAIQGACIGGGVDMICAADSRYCTGDAYFVIKEIELGMTADVGTLQRLPHLISQGMVRELAYTGRKFSADEALASGLVNHVYDDQQSMLDSVMELATQITRHSPLAVAGSKEMLNYSRDHAVDESLRYMATWQAGMFQQTDIMEAMTAQQQKRLAEYEGLRQLPDTLAQTE